MDELAFAGHVDAAGPRGNWAGVLCEFLSETDDFSVSRLFNSVLIAPVNLAATYEVTVAFLRSSKRALTKDLQRAVKLLNQAQRFECIHLPVSVSLLQDALQAMAGADVDLDLFEAGVAMPGVPPAAALCGTLPSLFAKAKELQGELRLPHRRHINGETACNLKLLIRHSLLMARKALTSLLSSRFLLDMEEVDMQPFL